MAPFGGLHALGDGHAPRGVDGEEDEVGCFADAHLALQVRFAQGVGHAAFGLLRGALLLEGGSGAQGGVEGDVVGAVAGGAGLNITAALAVRMCARAAAGLAARQLIERGIQAARLEFASGFDFLPAFPPIRVLRAIEDVLRRGLSRVQVRRLTLAFGRLAQRRTFFLSSISPSPDSPG